MHGFKPIRPAGGGEPDIHSPPATRSLFVRPVGGSAHKAVEIDQHDPRRAPARKSYRDARVTNWSPTIGNPNRSGRLPSDSGEDVVRLALPAEGPRGIVSAAISDSGGEDVEAWLASAAGSR
jgi:hypothetical protein